MKHNSFFVFIILLVLSFGFYSCEQERDPCLEPTSVSLRVHSLHHLPDGTITDTLLPDPAWLVADSFKGWKFSQNSSQFALSLSPLADSCRLVIQPDTASMALDTLTFYYSRSLQFLSNACGYTYFFNLERIIHTQHLIESVVIKNPDVNSNVNTPEHVQIFF